MARPSVMRENQLSFRQRPFSAISCAKFGAVAQSLTDPVLQVIRRELRRIFPDVRIEADEIKTVLTSEVMKREVMEGDMAEEARRKISRSLNKVQKEKAARKESSDSNGSDNGDCQPTADVPEAAAVNDSQAE